MQLYAELCLVLSVFGGIIGCGGLGGATQTLIPPTCTNCRRLSPVEPRSRSLHTGAAAAALMSNSIHLLSALVHLKKPLTPPSHADKGRVAGAGDEKLPHSSAAMVPLQLLLRVFHLDVSSAVMYNPFLLSTPVFLFIFPWSIFRHLF